VRCQKYYKTEKEKTKCDYVKSLRHNTFLFHRQLNFLIFLKFASLWLANVKIGIIANQQNMSKKSVSELNLFCRKVSKENIVEYLNNHQQICIGNIIIEV